jgi:hypothetical protein
MGILNKITGGPDKKLLQTGLLGRGIITEVRPTGTTFQSGNGLVQRVCLFTVEVSLDNRAPYMATCKQRFPEIELARIQPGNTTVAVRANPDDLAQIVLDLATEPPIVPRLPRPGQDRGHTERRGHRLGSGRGGSATLGGWLSRCPGSARAACNAVVCRPTGRSARWDGRPWARDAERTSNW